MEGNQKESKIREVVAVVQARHVGRLWADSHWSGGKWSYLGYN